MRTAGSGLGLYNARLFVDRFHGAISVESAEDRGTTFKVWLPEANFTETLEPAEAPAPKRHSLLLLGQPGEVLEDIAQFLRSNGFHVVATISFENATAALQSNDYEFSLVMLLAEPQDRDLLKIIPVVRRERPNLKLMLKLVGRDEEEVQTSILDRVDRVLAADVTPGGLLNHIRQCL